MFIASVIALAALLVTGVVLVCSAHIPVIREWTGAAPLQPQEDDQTDQEARDLAASVAAGFMTVPDWGTEQPHLELPAADGDDEPEVTQ